MKTIIHENARGFLFNNGRFVKMLAPGKYHTFGDRIIEVADLEAPICSGLCSLDTLLADGEIAKQAVTVEVADQQLALHYVNGKFCDALTVGKHAYWTVFDKHEFRILDISSPEAANDVPEYIFASLPLGLYKKVEVAQYQKARLYIGKKFVKLLESGTYYFWHTGISVDVETVDTRLTQMNIVGQEILTQDKVSIRVNFVASYKITDFVKIATEINNFEEQVHIAAQLALRDYVGKHKLDEILENKEEMSAYVFERLKAKENEFFLEITDAGVKDIILPGEIRDIMNTVLVAEKRAQANVITRREEVASTRSLLNTAKLMDENQTLYKLKELEYIERICENVGNINLGSGGDILTQLAAVLRGSAT
ncbi:MAG: slipin family protein [Clostridia bacterium]|nr:slipin family protein [Clostridia bacterium]